MIVDPVALPVLDSVRATLCSSFRRDLEAYLATRPGLPQTLDSIVAGGEVHVTTRARLERLAQDSTGDESAALWARRALRFPMG